MMRHNEAGGNSDTASDSPPGRNPDHAGSTQPQPDLNQTVQVWKACCPDCDCVLTDLNEYVSGVIVNIPLPVPIEVTKYKLKKQECACSKGIIAEHLDCLETGRFGPVNLAKPHSSAVMDGFLMETGQTVRPATQPSGSTCNDLQHDQAGHRQLRPAYGAVKDGVRESDLIYCNEISFPINGDQHWLWTFVTGEDVFYIINESRGSQVLKGFLDNELAEDATLSCDGWSECPSHHGKLQQCWRICFGRLRSEVRVRILETLSTQVATWERQGLDPSDQLTLALGS
jgi:hypothetical protein